MGGTSKEKEKYMTCFNRTKNALIAILSTFILPVAAALHAVEGVTPAVYYGSGHAVTSGDKTAELAVIVIHGWGGGAKASDHKTLREDLAKRGVKAYVVAPLFPRRSTLKKAKVADDGRAVWGASWDVPGQRGGPADDWRGGGDAVGTSLSSFDIVDRLMETLSDVRLYPALKRVVLVGFSAGGQFTGRYVATGKCPLRKGLAVDFAVIAPSTELRLDPDTTWHYGLKDRPRYSAKLTEADIRRNLASRRVWRGCGTADVTRGSLDVSPPAMQQGKNRYDRFTNFKDYLKGYPDWVAKVSFHDIPGIGHSGAVYRNASFLDFLAGSCK